MESNMGVHNDIQKRAKSAAHAHPGALIRNLHGLDGPVKYRNHNPVKKQKRGDTHLLPELQRVHMHEKSVAGIGRRSVGRVIMEKRTKTRAKPRVFPYDLQRRTPQIETCRNASMTGKPGSHIGKAV